MPDQPAEKFPSPSDSPRERRRALLKRFLQSRGPVTIDDILQRYPLPRQEIEELLEELAKAGAAYRGRLTQDANAEQWCDRRNFEQLYRRAIQERRRAFAPKPAENFLRFLWRWHSIGQLQNPAQLLPLLQRLRGLFLPLNFLEREILRARIPTALLSQQFAACHLQLASLCQQGELIWRLYQEEAGHAKLTQFFLRGEGHLFYSREQLAEQANQLSAPAKTVREFLRENGASFFRDLAAGSGLSKSHLGDGLAELAWRGFVTNDSLLMLQELAEHGAPRLTEAVSSEAESQPQPETTAGGLQEFLDTNLPEWRKRSQSRWRQYTRRRELKKLPQLNEGRWSLVESFSIYGKPQSAPTNVETQSLAQQQAYLLLERYGILVKEWYRRENGLLPWYAIFQALKQMEWRGDVRRGYFVEGLSGVQFALPQIVEMLAASEAQTIPSGPTMLSALDPAVPFGSGVNLPLAGFDDQLLPLVRQAGNHLLFVEAKPVLYAENYGSRLWSLSGATGEQVEPALACLRQFLLLPEPLRPRKRIEVESWNGKPVTATSAVEWLQPHGFEKEDEKMVLWPSRV
jgi:ATP-dependent helicase Lhr and Lhr-like helicase